MFQPNLTVLLLLCALTEGCVGIGAIKTRTETFQDPVVTDEPTARGLSQGNPHQTNIYMESWLFEHWGKPTTIKHTATDRTDEIHTYKFGLAWEGVVPVAFIPLPLLLPTGREQVHFTLHDGNVISAKLYRAHSNGGAYGLYPRICGFGFGPFSLND